MNAANTNIDANGTAEFDCVDCKVHVISFAHAGQTLRCAMCQYIDQVPDPAQRAALQAWRLSVSDR